MLLPICAGGRRCWGANASGSTHSKTVNWALLDGLGAHFWQHDWGSPKSFTHPAAHLRQVEIDERSVGGVGVDLDHVLKPPFGQWD